MSSKLAIPNCIFKSSLFSFLLTMTFCFTSYQSSLGQEAIPKETLDSLKAATVYVRVTSGRSGGSGSGFLIGKKNGYAYIITNEHVVKKAKGYHDRRVEVDFFRGTKKRRSFKATVLSEDPSRDLAVLRIKDHEEIPDQISLKSKKEVRETQGVFILGFPFGEALATNRQAPKNRYRGENANSTDNITTNPASKVYAIAGLIKDGFAMNSLTDPRQCHR